MRTLLFLIRKEFIQIFRDRFIGKAIFAIPIVQMLILVPAITFEIRDIRLCLADMDISSESRELITQLQGSEFFNIVATTFSEMEAKDMLHRDKCDVVIQIPSGFGRNMTRENSVQFMVLVNAINASNAQLSWAYLTGIIRDYNMNPLIRKAGKAVYAEAPQIVVTHRYWYNETLNYKYYMLPGVLGILVAAIGFMLAGLNMVKEKETGTIEQINVTPVKKIQFIIAKMIPFIIIGLFDLAIGISVGMLTFGMPFEGSVALLFLCSFIFLIAALGLALFISTFSDTQQQFMFAGFFFLIIFMLMSGIFTPMESMPEWAQKVNLLNPVAYIMRINRMIMLKGSTFQDIGGDILNLLIIALAFTSFAVWKFKKTT